MFTRLFKVVKVIKHMSLGIVAIGLYPVAGQAETGQFYVAPGAQFLNFDDGTQLHNDQGFSLGLGYDFTQRLTGEIAGFDMNVKGPDNQHIDYRQWRVDVLFDLNTRIGPLDTFVIGGLGENKFDSDRDSVLNFGAGVEYKLANNLTWRTAARTFYATNQDHEDLDLGIDTSLVLRFGKSSNVAAPIKVPTPAPVPVQPQLSAPVPAAPVGVDTDGDGVADNSDACPDTPKNYAVDQRGCPILAEEVVRVDLKVNFDFDRSEVKPEYFAQIESIANFMKQYADVVVKLEGHTDSVGTDEYNRVLSERRANAVGQILIDRFGMQASRVSTLGHGESRPVASNDTQAGRAENRRMMAVITKTLQKYRKR